MPFWRSFTRRRAHQTVGARLRLRQVLCAELRLRAQRLAVLDDRLVELRVVRDRPDRADRDRERPALDARAPTPISCWRAGERVNGACPERAAPRLVS